MMNCTDIEQILDEYNDGELSAEERLAVESHTQGCESCRESLAEVSAMREALRVLPVVEASPDFEERVFAEVRKQHAPASSNRFMTGFATAMVASFALWFASTIFLPSVDEAQLQMIDVASNEASTVRLMFESAEDIESVTLSLVLPDNVQIKGYEGRRKLTWQTSLTKGENILALPIIAIGNGQGELVAILNYGDKSKQLRILLRTNNDGALNTPLEMLSPESVIGAARRPVWKAV
jgi:hypothetical protein